MQPYMLQKPLDSSRLEFLWDTDMLVTRMTMKGKYPKGEYSCPHCREGREEGVQETPLHLLSNCTAYQDLRQGLDPELILEHRAIFLRAAIVRRKELEKELGAGARSSRS